MDFRTTKDRVLGSEVKTFYFIVHVCGWVTFDE
jgi:hypothetical protein